jgi:hypothetical protein
MIARNTKKYAVFNENRLHKTLFAKKYKRGALRAILKNGNSNKKLTIIKTLSILCDTN